MLRLESRPKNIEGEGEIAIRELVRNSLRMRPDRIIVGEVRGAEALDMLQAMNTGHDGSMSTVHANSPRDALHRIETMVLMAGYDLPVRAIRQQVSSALDLIVHLDRFEDGSRRVSHITEVQRMESDVITLQDLFEFKIESIAADRTITGGAPSDRPPADVPPQVREARRRAADNLFGTTARRSSPRSCEGSGDHEATRRAAALVAAVLVAAAARDVRGCGRDRGRRPDHASRPCSNFPDMAFAVVAPERPGAERPAGPRHRERQPGSRRHRRRSRGPRTVGTVLVIDASKSMEGQPIEQAMAAARAFAARRNPSQQLAVVFFNDDVIVAPAADERPGVDRRCTREGATARQRTRISTTRSRRPRRCSRTRGITNGSIVLLSDGKDVGSTVDQETAIDAVKDAQARVFAVGLHSSQFDPIAPCRIVADKTSGTYSEAATAAALSQIYSELGYTLLTSTCCGTGRSPARTPTSTWRFASTAFPAPPGRATRRPPSPRRLRRRSPPAGIVRSGPRSH